MFESETGMKAYEIQQNLDALQSLAEDINRWAVGKGFQTLPEELQQFLVKCSPEAAIFVERLIKSQKIALMHSELSEQLEGVRKPGPSDLEGFSQDEEEVADLIIRALNYAGQWKLRIGAAIGAKMAKNEGRPFMHGKKF